MGRILRKNKSRKFHSTKEVPFESNSLKTSILEIREKRKMNSNYKSQLFVCLQDDDYLKSGN